MGILRAFALLILLAPMLQAQVQTQGGGINWVEVQASQSPVWYGILGRVSPEKAQALVLEATPGGLATLAVNTSESDCDGPVDSLNIIFSTSSGAILFLSPGDTALLDARINNADQDGSRTFLETSAFSTGAWGSISDVPTAYLNSQSDRREFRMGFLRDQDGNFVFISAVNKNQVGFDGSISDFEAMLPAIDGKATVYYAQADLKCSRRAGTADNTVPQPQDNGQASPLLANQLVDFGTNNPKAAGGGAGAPDSGSGIRIAVPETAGAQMDLAASLSEPGFLPELASKAIWFLAGFALIVAVAVGGFLLTRRHG